MVKIPFKEQKPIVTLFGGDVAYCIRRESKLDYQKEKISSLMRQYIRQSQLSTTKAEEALIELVPKQAKILPYMEFSRHAPIGCSIST